MSALFNNTPVNSPQIVSIKDAMALPAFNAMYAVQGGDYSAQNCKDPLLGTSFMKNVIHDAIRSGGAKVDYNFFFDMFGFSPMKVNTTKIYNRYLSDVDHNIYVAGHAKATGAGLPFTATVLRENHVAGGKYSRPSKYYTLVDKTNNIWYSIEDVDTTVDYAHKMTLKPWDGTVVGELKSNTKYLILEGRPVGGNSVPHDTTAAIGTGWAQPVAPFRFRKDWSVKTQMLRGYENVLRFTLLWDKDGNKVDAWDSFEAQNSRDQLQMLLNVIAFIGTPVTNTDFINGAGAMVVDDVHTGFYGMLPTIQYGGGNVIDFDPAIGFDLDGDLEPFFLNQDTIKQTSRFLIRHGNAFKAGLNRRANRMVKYEGLGLADWKAFNKQGEKLTKLETSAYEYMGYVIDFSKWGALNDTRFMGTKKFDNMGIGLALDGIVDANTNQALDPIEFYQYGDKETSAYEEYQVDNRSVLRTESIDGWCANSIMMATHCPQKHLLFNPTV